MTEPDFLAERFEEHRGRLAAVAYRILGSRSEADDAVQEAWLRLARTDADGIDNLAAWLTTVVGRVCLDVLRSRRNRREEPLDEPSVGDVTGGGADPESEALLADSVGVAMLVVLETLTPAERLAFVLHDMFAVPFDEIASIIDRSEAAARQLASRGRRRVRHQSPMSDVDLSRQRRLVDAFLAASRGGDFAALVSVLDPDVVLRADSRAVAGTKATAPLGAPLLASRMDGAEAVARAFSGRASAARAALVDGVPAAVFAPSGRVLVVFGFTVSADRVVEVTVTSDPAEVRRMDVRFLD